MRPAGGLTVVALVLGAATAFAVAASASVNQVPVLQLVVIAFLIYAGSLIAGSARVISIASLPMLAAALVEARAQDPAWVRAIVVGCLWFVAVEVAWEAVGRRDASRHTRAANLRRVQEVTTVVILTLVLGLVAVSAVSLAPVRSVALQALALIAVFIGFVALVRQLGPIR